MPDKPRNNPEARLDDESAVSRAYGELRRPEPPAHVDERILAEARRATAKPDNVIRVQRWRKWAMPAALAATVVFAVPLVVRVFSVQQVYSPAEQNAATMEAGQQEAADNKQMSKLEADQAAPASPTQDRGPHGLAATRPARSAESAESEPVLQGSRDELVKPEGLRPASQFLSAESAASGSPDVSAMPSPANNPKTASARQAEAYAGSPPGDAAIGNRARETGIEQKPLSDSNIAVLDPEPWLTEIAALHRRGLVRTSRRELGRFLQAYPGYALPDRYPLQAADAIFDHDKTDAMRGDIVPEAASWLRGISMMAQRGDIDQARTQLAEFLAIYPDYPLPADFPLTRRDARPIER